MDSLNINSATIVTLLVVVVLKIVFDFIQSFKKPKIGDELAWKINAIHDLLETELKPQIKDLHVWHDETDEDGVRRWFNSAVIRVVLELKTLVLRLMEKVKQLETKLQCKEKGGTKG